MKIGVIVRATVSLLRGRFWKIWIFVLYLGCNKTLAEDSTDAKFTCQSDGTDGKIEVGTVCKLDCNNGIMDISVTKYREVTCVGCNSTNPQKDCPDGGPWKDSKGDEIPLETLPGICKACIHNKDPIIEGIRYEWQCFENHEDIPLNTTTPAGREETAQPDSKETRRKSRRRVRRDVLGRLLDLGSHCTITCGNRNATSSSDNKSNESFTIECVPAQSVRERHNRWVVKGTNTTYKEEDIELDCPGI